MNNIPNIPIEKKTTIKQLKISIPLTLDELDLLPECAEFSSPKFIVIDKRTKARNPTEWFISVNLKYPKAPDHIGVYLWHVFDNDFVDFEIKCAFSIIDCDQKPRNHYRFKQTGSKQPNRFTVGSKLISHKELFADKSKLLTNQILTIQCELEIVNLGYCSSSLSKLQN